MVSMWLLCLSSLFHWSFLAVPDLVSVSRWAIQRNHKLLADFRCFIPAGGRPQFLWGRHVLSRTEVAAWAAGVGGTALSLVVSHRVRKGRGAPSRWRHTRRGSTGSLASRRWRGVRSTRAVTWGKTGQYPGFVFSNVEDVRTLNSEAMKPTVSEGSHLECIRFPQILQGGGGLWAPLGVRGAPRRSSRT